jgi:ABC-type uncharacterized transport system permease subunit
MLGKPGLFFMFLLFSFVGLWRFSQDVRTVNVVGLFVSGVVAGAVLTGIIVLLKAKREP